MEKTVHVFGKIRKRRRGILIFSTFFLSYVIGVIVDPFDAFWRNYFHRPITTMLWEWFTSLIFWAIVVEVSLQIDNLFNKRIPWTGYPLKRLLVQTSIQVVAIIGIVLIADLLFFNEEDLDQSFTERDLYIGFLRWTFTSLVLSFLISMLNTGTYLITNLKQAIMETAEHKVKAAEHKQAAVEAELQALKLQLDPHFVFNNLSVLSELILKDQQLGYQYSENFSKVYRYLLQKADQDLVKVGEELKFLNAYIFLIKQRAGEGVQFEINIDKDLLHLQLPTLTLQMLLENALKHNKTLKSDPLKVRIYNNDKKELIVENTLFPLERKAISSGLGIKNIISRYRLISDKTPEIIVENNSFKVIVPLINA